MKNAVVCIVVLAVFGAGVLVGGWYRQREVVGARTLQARKILYYVDPMHPTYKSDKPGVAPDCGMRLEPVYDDERGGAIQKPMWRGGAGTLHVSPDTQQLVGVRVAAVERTAATERLRLYGRVTADETRSYTIDVGVDGYIRDLAPVTTGSRVRKDQWLATFSAVDLRPAIQGFIVALELMDRSTRPGAPLAEVAVGNASLQQSIDRLLTYGISRTQLEEIARTRQVPANVKITAPAEGFVVLRNVSIGQKFRRGDELYHIADLSHVWIVADVFGGDAEQVSSGATARVSVPGHALSRTARVSTAVLPQFDPVTQAVTLRLEADNPDYLLRPDMLVDVELAITRPSAIAVPIEAVVDSGREQTIFVDRGNGMFEARRVRTGWRSGERVQIVDGLTVGERIVVSGAFLLDSETRIRRADPDSGSRR